MGHKRPRPSFETPRKRAAPQDDGGVCGASMTACPGRSAARSSCEAVRCRAGVQLACLTGVPALRSSVKNAAPRPGHERNLLSPQSSDLPDGRPLGRAVESYFGFSERYFCFHTPQITSRTFRIPSHTEGRFAIATDVGAGCGGRGSVLRAMGSQGGSMRPVSDHQASGREMLQRTAKSCGPDAPTLASSSRSGVGPTGLRQNLIR